MRMYVEDESHAAHRVSIYVMKQRRKRFGENGLNADKALRN